MSNELLAAFGITDEDLKKASDEKSSSSRSGKKKTTKKKVKEYALPLRVCGGCRQKVFHGEGVITD